jgi:hypothetical protein
MLSKTLPTSLHSSRLNYLAVKSLRTRPFTKATNTYLKTLRCIQEELYFSQFSVTKIENQETKECALQNTFCHYV